MYFVLFDMMSEDRLTHVCFYGFCDFFSQAADNAIKGR